MGERGENFAALVNTLIAKPEDKTAYLSWLNHLRPEEIEDVRILPGAASDLLFALKESGQVFPAPVLSDGTLRFAALAAALFQPDMPGILTIEEIENGIHPARLRLLIELLRTQAAQGCAQMMVTTHSPALLAWLRPEEYRHTFWCQRDDETGASNITPLSKIPHFTDAVKSTSLSSLLTEGWLEGAL